MKQKKKNSQNFQTINLCKFSQSLQGYKIIF